MEHLKDPKKSLAKSRDVDAHFEKGADIISLLRKDFFLATNLLCCLQALYYEKMEGESSLGVGSVAASLAGVYPREVWRWRSRYTKGN